jgi:hypothetical protein
MTDEPHNEMPEIEPLHRRRGWPMTPEHKKKMAEGRARAREQARKKTEARQAREARAPVQTNIFAGMTVGEGWNSHCPDACNKEQGCVITRRKDHIGVCSHPEKGGLQAAYQVRPDVVEKHNRMRKYAEHLKVDKR